MHLNRLYFGAIAAAIASSGAIAQDFPVKPVRIFTSAVAGGPQDQSVRLLAEHLSSVWKHRVLVENRAGASGLVAAQPVLTAAPDGHTLLIALPSLSSLHVFNKNPGIHPLKDFVPVSQISFASMVMVVNADQSYKTLSEFIDYAKAHPGKLNYSAGSGGQVLYFEYLKLMAGIDVRSILYKGDMPGMLAVATNDVQVSFGGIANVRSLIQAGKLRAVGVTTLQRAKTAPDIPTIAEGGVPGFDVYTWNGIVAPASTPQTIRNFIAAEMGAFLRKPETARAYNKFNYEPRSSTPEEFGNLMRTEFERFTEVARKASIKPE